MRSNAEHWNEGKAAVSVRRSVERQSGVGGQRSGIGGRRSVVSGRSSGTAKSVYFLNQSVIVHFHEDREFTPLAWNAFAFDFDFAAVLPDDLIGDCQT